MAPTSQGNEAATTQAIAPLRVALLGMFASGLLSLYFAHDHPYLTALPCVLINCCFLQISFPHGLLFSLIEIPWMMLLFYPIQYLLHIPLQYAFFWLYSPIFVVLARKNKDRHNLLGRLFIRYVWDPPLLACIWLVGKTGLGGDRFLTPFASIIDEEVVMGSLPLPWDVAHLVKEFNIGAVVNMTIEYPGPLEEYALHGVEQLHLPTVDTAAPTLEQVHQGVDFIAAFLKAHPGKRVFIHCKGGRGRAAVMAAAWYLRKAGGKEAPRSVVRRLKEKRHVVSTAVEKYETVQAYHALVVKEGGKEEGMEEMVVDERTMTRTTTTATSVTRRKVE